MTRARRSAVKEYDPVTMRVVMELMDAAIQAAQSEADAERDKKLRDDAIRRAKDRGLSLAEIATLTSLSRARIQQLAPMVAEEEAVEEGTLSTAVSG